MSNFRLPFSKTIGHFASLFVILINMDWIDQIEHFNTFGLYPFATVAHILIGIWCGRELELGRIKRDISQSLPGFLVFFGWLAYEIIEFARLHDEGDVDIANGLGGVLIGIFIYRLLPVIKNKIRGYNVKNR